MSIPLTPGTPISFDQLNDALGNSPNQSTLDLETAGIGFGLDLDPANWSDSDIGLSMDEFRGGGAVATAADITYVNPSTYVWQNIPAGTPNPTTNFGQFLQPTAVSNPNPNPAVNPSPGYITAGPHTLTFGVTANGTYVVANSLNVPTAPINPANGIDGAPPGDNLHTLTLPALPYSWESPPTTPSPTPTWGHSPSTVYNGFFAIQDRFPTPIAPAVVLESATIRRMYNDKYLDSTVVNIPASAGTHTVGYIDWRWSLTQWGLTTAAPGNPLPNTAPWVTGQSKGAGISPSTNNFYRTPITVTVDANPSPTTSRTTYIYAYLPTTFNPTPVGKQMNYNGNPPGPATHYYPITIVQNANPASAPTMTITPSPISLDYSGTSVPVSLNVNPNTKSYSVAISGPNAPHFSFSPTSSPKSGDATINVSATEYTGASPRTATLTTTIPAPLPADIVTTTATIEQAGIDLKVGGYPVGTTVTDPVPSAGQSFVTRQIITNAPSNAPWSVTKSPFITIPATTSGTGPSPTFGYTVTANPGFTPRPGHVTVDFDVDGSPYKTIFDIQQDETDATPAITVSQFQGNDTFPFNGAEPLQTRQILIDTNEPFTVALTGDTPYWTRNTTPTVPATATSFTVTTNAPSPYVFEYTTPAVNDDYTIRTATFTVTSPVQPGTYTRYLQMGRNPGEAYLSFQHPNFPAGTPAFDGMFTYNSGPGTVSIAKEGGTGKAWVSAHPELGWSLSVTTPAPGIPGIPLTISPTSTSGTGPTPNGVTYTIPINTPTSEQSILWTLSSPATQTQTVIGVQPPGPIPNPATSTPEPEPQPEPTPLTLTLSSTSYSAPRTGGSKVFGATGDAPFTKSIPAPISPWVSVSPTGAQTAGPAVSPTTFTVTVASQPATTPAAARSGTISIPSPAGNKSISVGQSENQQLTLTPSSDVTNIPNAGATYTFIASGGGSVQVPQNPAPWITASPSTLQKTALADKTIEITVSANPTSPGQARNFDVTFNTPDSSDDYTINFAQLSNIPVPAYTAITLRVTAVESNACSGLAASFSGYVDGGSFANATTIYTNQSGTKYASRNGASVWFSNSTIRRQWNDSTKTLGTAISC